MVASTYNRGNGGYNDLIETVAVKLIRIQANELLEAFCERFKRDFVRRLHLSRSRFNIVHQKMDLLQPRYD